VDQQLEVLLSDFNYLPYFWIVLNCCGTWLDNSFETLMDFLTYTALPRRYGRREKIKPELSINRVKGMADGFC